MKRAVGLVVAIGVAVAAVAVRADDNQARAIMERVEARDDGDNAIAEMEMVLIDRRGKERVRAIRSFTKDRGDDTLQVMFFLHPPDVEGTGFLTHDYGHGEREDDQWLYLPALRQSRRIAASGKSGSFMGSDFNYSDLSSRDLDDYDYRLVSSDEVEGHEVWVIEAVPRARAVIDETGYEKSLILVRKDIDVVVRAVHWVKGGEDLRYFDVKRLELVDDIWVATEIHMTTKRSRQTRHKTVLRLGDIRFNQDLAEELFTVRRLELGP